MSPARDRPGVWRRRRVIAAHRAARRRPPPSVGRSPSSRPVAVSLCPGLAAGQRERPRQAVAHGALPRRGVRDGVRYLRVLLAGAGLLWGGLPRPRATAPAAARACAASAQPGRPARSPRPPTGLPRAVSPPAREVSTFPPAPAIHNHHTTAARHPAIRPVCLVCGRVWAPGDVMTRRQAGSTRDTARGDPRKANDDHS